MNTVGTEIGELAVLADFKEFDLTCPVSATLNSGISKSDSDYFYLQNDYRHLSNEKLLLFHLIGDRWQPRCCLWLEAGCYSVQLLLHHFEAAVS